MGFLDNILGRPLRSSEDSKEKISALAGVPLLGLDALSSVAYGPEAMLWIFVPLGMAGLHWLQPLTLVVMALLGILYVSYRQTIAAYPNGGGSYLVAKENLGERAGLLAASALLLDYVLNVAVGISAGVAAIVSAFPPLQTHMLALCLVVLAGMTQVNLRGIRESSTVFALPTFAFVGSIGVYLALGFFRVWQGGGHPVPLSPPPPIPRPTEVAGLWMILRGFAAGCTAMTGVEAVSNGVPLFQKPQVQNAHRALTMIVVVLGVMLAGVAWLCPLYHIGAMDEQKPGYQTLLSQLTAAVAGHGVIYYASIVSMLAILTFSANTSFAGFPRVCFQLAEDGFLPLAFANRGRRLVFSIGICVLAAVSALIMVAFGGITENLIPLFAVGAFGAFTFSQGGMVMHWKKNSGKGSRTALVVNGTGAVCTGIALLVIIVAKFAEGAWITLIIVPGVMVMFQRIKAHYVRVSRKLDRPVTLETSQMKPPAVLVPIDGWNCVTELALRFGLEMSDDVTALHVTSSDEHGNERLREIWKEYAEKPAVAAGLKAPRLEIVSSPYRQVYKPILDFVKKMKKEKPGRLIAVVIPELVEPHWYEYVLHNLHGAGLRALLFVETGPTRTVVITTPWHLRGK